MKHIAWILLVAFVAALSGCAKDKAPSVRVQNERATKANVQVKMSDANTININDVAGGQVSPYQDIVSGKIDVTVVIQNETVSPTATFLASVNTNYTIVVLGSNPPSLRVDSSSK